MVADLPQNDLERFLFDQRSSAQTEKRSQELRANGSGLIFYDPPYSCSEAQ